MPSKRVFKTRTFARWAKRLLADEALCSAAREIEAGRFEADLGGGVCKKRVALAGQGKSGSTRTLVAKQNAYAIIFLAGREKSDPGNDFSINEVNTAKIVAKGLEKADGERLTDLAGNGSLVEICDSKEKI